MLNGYLSPKIYGKAENPHLWEAFGAGFLFCIASAIPLFISLTIDKISENEDKRI